MSLILTAPERLALMAYDASTLVRFTNYWFTEQVDDDMRPAVLVEVGEGDFPGTASNVEAPVETYELSIIGQTFAGADGNQQHEAEVRRVSSDIVNYFFKRTQLQFSNQRSRSGYTELGPLVGVQHARIRRGLINAMTKADMPPFWGCQITVTVTEFAEAMEILYRGG